MAEPSRQDRPVPRARTHSGHQILAEQSASSAERRSSDSASTSSLAAQESARTARGVGIENRKHCSEELIAINRQNAHESPPKACNVEKTPRRTRGKLDAARSLEAEAGGSHFKSASRQQQVATATATNNNQQRQTFSLKQLALQSRNLNPISSKKRSSLQSEQSGAKAASLSRFLFEHSSNQVNSLSSSGSSADSSAADTDGKRSARRGASEPSSGSRNRAASVDELDEHNDSDLEEEEDLSSCSEDDNQDEEDEDDQLEDGDQSASDSSLGPTPTPSTMANDELRRQQQVAREQRRQRRQRRKRRSKRQLALRQSQCCNCDQLASKIDQDGLPVTDVDLVTYRELCQMEQQVHQMRTSRRRNHPAPMDAHRGSFAYGSGELGCGLRRSSLQEESGAYYQLCTSNEEQAIRQKYAWYPPSLKQVGLVDEFFAQFSREKVPLVALQAETLKQLANENSQDNSGKLSAVIRSVQDMPNLTAPSFSGKQAIASSLTSSNRDEQISFQLPRQDISLDYCSYSMSDASRTAYLQFVDKRNSGALDVGTVVQVKPFAQSSALSARHSVSSLSGRPVRHRPAGSGSRSPLFEHEPAQSGSTGQRHSKLPGANQTAVALLAASQSQQEQLAGQQVSGCSGAQRCRRCLVRFEPRQLAVAAPNFIIGSALYRASNIPEPLEESAVSRPDRSALVGAAELRLAAGQTIKPSAQHQSPPTNVALFHPTCFTCSTCKEFLVDLVYCLRDNKLYCVRHYGESLRPRCSWCQELIFSDEYLKAMNESFHVDHFLCRHCDCNLAGQRYVLKDEKPFCIQCYEGNFANICEDCQKPIGIDSRDLSYKDRHWHDTCFLCNKCQQSLIDKPFGSKLDKVITIGIYCADCYDITFATRCDGCKNPFRAGSKKMEYRDKQWHDSCFCCCVCQNTIGSNSFIPKNDEIYCIKCYEDKYATKCTKCKQVIVSGGVTFRNEPWHRDCFNCCNCSKSLAGQRFTTRDVKNETVKNTNKTNQPHNAYCIDCYGELFAKKCYACSKAITGLGGTRFVTFEDRSWHNDCFICNDCNNSLVGKGFITDGPDTILCGDCARAKLR